MDFRRWCVRSMGVDGLEASLWGVDERDGLEASLLGVAGSDGAKRFRVQSVQRVRLIQFNTAPSLNGGGGAGLDVFDRSTALSGCD